MKKNEMPGFLEGLTDDQTFQVAMLEEGLIHRVARRVMQFRKSLGMSQEALASLIGTKQPRVANIEAGEANITLRTLAQLSFALKCEPENFVVERQEYITVSGIASLQATLDDIWSATVSMTANTTPIPSLAFEDGTSVAPAASNSNMALAA